MYLNRDRNRKVFLVIAAIAFAATTSTWASDSDARLCVQITDDTERLRCFDAAFSESAATDEGLPAYERRLLAEQQEQHDWFAITRTSPRTFSRPPITSTPTTTPTVNLATCSATQN